ncbi:MAG: vesicle coat component [Cirrosporium novae-zelandiae]|nr:MAG: vesicle coat component [Cirrosporium novae-zelandiae]
MSSEIINNEGGSGELEVGTSGASIPALAPGSRTEREIPMIRDEEDDDETDGSDDNEDDELKDNPHPPVAVSVGNQNHTNGNMVESEEESEEEEEGEDDSDAKTPALDPSKSDSNSDPELLGAQETPNLLAGQNSTTAEPPKTKALTENTSHSSFWEESHEEKIKGIDPAWGLERTHTESFKMLDSIERTNSFPEVPLHSTEPIHDNKIEITHATLEGNGYKHTLDEALEDQFGDNEENHIVNEFGGNEEHIRTPSDAEARFEEGIPLVSEHDNEAQTSKVGLQDEAIGAFGQSGNDAEEGFFNKPLNSKESYETRPPNPDRKNTAHVLNSMRFQSHGNHGHRRLKSVIRRGDASSAAFWEAALSDDEFLDEDAESAEPAAFFEDDGEGFLEEAAAISHDLAGAESSPIQQYSAQMSQEPSNHTAPQHPNGARGFSYEQNHETYSSTRPNHTISSSNPSTSPYFAGAPFEQPASRPNMLTKAESFVDKSKGGYHSPYDLPFDMNRPKHRVSRPQLYQPQGNQGGFATGPQPPPRSSSFGPSQASTMPPAPISSQTRSIASSSDMSPPQSSHGDQVFQAPLELPEFSRSRPALKPKASSSSFFEDLPIDAKPRHVAVHTGRNSPQVNTPLPRSGSIPPPPPRRRESQPFQGHQPPDPYPQYQLQSPERVNPYSQPSQPLPPPQAPSSHTSRYSPAPQPLGHVAPGRTKYAAPPAAPPVQHRPLPYQPRTSSPLAQAKPFPQQQQQQQQQHPPVTISAPSSSSNPLHRNQSLPNQVVYTGFEQGTEHNTRRRSDDLWETNATGNSIPAIEPQQTGPYIPYETFASNSITNAPPMMSPPREAFAAPQYSPEAPQHYPRLSNGRQTLEMPIVPPQRAHTQSPSLMSGRGLPIISHPPYERPASVNDPTSPTVDVSFSSLHNRLRLSQELNFIPPTDGREQDPLQRWRGCPIVVFGFGGTIVSSFPQQTPRYSAGQVIPQIKCSPGEVHIRSAKDIFPLPDQLAKFPGPLKSKGQKKHVLNWLTDAIAGLEGQFQNLQPDGSLPDPWKRHEEKILLWKIVKVLVENDGTFSGNEKVDRAVAEVLNPQGLEQDNNGQASFTAGADFAGISNPNGTEVRAEPVDPTTVNQLRKYLLHGDRSKAVWHAVDHRLWAHAMIISSTLSKDVWKQVIQEFVRQEVKIIGNNTESLAALYEIFAGNWDDSIDELVPPSARAGLQMVSTVSSIGPTKNALDGLDRWRETLSLILRNRTPEDEKGLAALARLLTGYGRTEAAHICQLFARSSASNVSGVPNDLQFPLILLGANHFQRPIDFARDIDAILLTEVYEFALSVLSSSPTILTFQYMQFHKLYHALMLAEGGFTSEALQYCDIIGSVVSKMARSPSPSVGLGLMSILDDLSSRLHRAPSDDSSWITKTSMDKMSGTMSKLFNSFVSGDDNAESKAKNNSNNADVGPFSKLAGTPNISPSASTSDLYNTMIGNSPPKANGNSRYVPNGRYTPRSSSDQQRQSSQTRKVSPYAPGGLTVEPLVSPRSVSQPAYPMPQPTSASIPSQQTQSYMPMPSEPSTPYMPTSYEPTTTENLFSVVGDHVSDSGQGSTINENSLGYNPPSYEPPSFGYQPPADDGYAPPAESNNDEDENDSSEKPKPKNKSFMDDDDDDFEAKAAAIIKSDKARKDREADEAVKRAAEADAKRDSTQGDKKGWFGSLFSKRNSQNGPIKAKLGEESSFYYDPDLKKWVNKKAGSSTPAPTSTPPPPKRGPTRTFSSPSLSSHASAPPRAIPAPMTSQTPDPTSAPLITNSSGPRPPSVSISPANSRYSALSPGDNSTPTGPPSLNGPPGAHKPLPSGPPSRISTPLSNASSIDDLLGAPTARKGGTIRKHKKRTGYVDVMANK